MIVLDTNVVSELARPAPETRVVAWVDAQQETLALTAVTVGELLHGVVRLPAGRRRALLAQTLERMLAEFFEVNVLPYDQAAAVEYASILSRRQAAGSPVSAAHAQIASICRSRGVRLASRNVRDFVDTGIEVVDPWNDPPP